MAIWLTYNGSGLISHNGYTLYPTQTPPPPTPEPIPVGAIRWQFYDDNLQNWDDAYDNLNVLSGNHGTWTPVRDEDSGYWIPGVYDWVGTNQFNLTFTRDRLSGLSAFDILDANIVSNVHNDFWSGAFEGVSNLRSFTVKTNIASSDRMTFNQMFLDCAVREVYLHLNSYVRSTNINDPFYNCYQLRKLTIVFDGETFPITVAGWIYASNLTDLTIVGTNRNTTNLIASDGWFINSQPTRYSLVNVTFAGFGSDIVTYLCTGTSMFMDDAQHLQSIKMYDTHGIPLENRYDNGLDHWTEVPIRLAGNQHHAFRMCTHLSDLNVDLSRVSNFEEGLANCPSLTSDAFYLKAYKQLQRALGHHPDNSKWFVASGMSRKMAACVDIDEGGTLVYAQIAGGSGLRFMFDDPTYVPTTDPSGNGTSTNGTWTAVDRDLGIWDWSGTTGSPRYDESSAFSLCTTLGFYITYRGTLRQGINDCVLIACGSNYSPSTMDRAFMNCSGLHDIINPIVFNYSAVSTFEGCQNLEDMPILQTTSISSVSSAFKNCVSVTEHVYDTYRRLSSMPTPPSMTIDCFTNCGPESERAQIPTSWGGTAT